MPPGIAAPAVISLLIPIIALLIPIFALYYSYKKEQAKRQERIKAIEKGVELPPEPVKVKQPLKTLGYLRRGLLSLAVGIGLWVGGTYIGGIDEEFAGLFSIAGIIVFLIGIALLIYYAVQKKAEQ